MLNLPGSIDPDMVMDAYLSNNFVLCSDDWLDSAGLGELIYKKEYTGSVRDFIRTLNPIQLHKLYLVVK